MNFLDLVRAVYEEAGVSGQPPSDVNAATGEAKRIVRWVKEAYRQIQLQSLTWKWMMASGSVTTTTGVNTYAVSSFSGTSRHRAWIPKSARIYKQSVGTADQTPLLYLSYEDWQAAYQLGAQSNGRPIHFTIGPNNTILLGPSPDDQYVVTIDFYKSVHELVSNTDVPELPPDYHYAIVYRALMKYARFESAPEIYDDAREDYLAEMRRLSIEFLEPVEWHTQALVE